MADDFPPIRAVAFDSADYHRILAFRHEWMRKPYGQVFSAEQLLPDAQSEHFLCEENAGIVGCVLLQRDSEILARLRQLVVHPQWRGKGLGAHLVRHFETIARGYGCTEAVLSARDYAIPFYEKLGYHVIGEGYLSNEIPHHKMVKSW